MPTSPWEEGGTAVVVGPGGATRRLAPSIRLFTLRTDRGTGFLGVSREMVHGYLELERETYTLSTGRTPGAPLAVMRAPSSAVQALCLTTAAAAPPPKLVEVDEPAQRLAGVRIYETTAFLEVDQPLRARLPSTQAAVDYATLLAGVTDAIYRRDAGARIRIPDGYLRVWEVKAPWRPLQPPYSTSNLVTWWTSGRNPDANMPRGQVHALTHYVHPDTGLANWGLAFGIGVLCDTSFSFATSSLEGSFPYPVLHTDPANGDLYVFAHEAGHLFGSLHTFQYTPPIDCVDGSGPDAGTIMSYCYGTGTLSFAGIGMRFHARVQNRLRRELSRSSPCVARRMIALGDYDTNGVLDPRDVAALDAHMVQGFDSLGAAETLDMNVDGKVDLLDRALLSSSLVPAATSQLFNGSGTNRLAYGAVRHAVLGESWEAIVGVTSTTPVPTVVVATRSQLSNPLSTRFGELLVQPGSLGGNTLFTSMRMSSGATAVHSCSVPADTALAGLTVETQAAVLGPSGLELLNGITLLFSTY